MALPSIQSYGDLKKVIQSWLNRKDQKTLENIPLFVNMAETEIYRDLKIRQFLVTSTVQVGSNLDILAPSDVNEYKNLYTRQKKSNDLLPLSRLSLSDLNGKKLGFALSDRFILVTKDFQSGDQILIEYYKEQPFLEHDSDVTVLLNIAPDLLIYAALEIAARWSNDNDEVSKWSSLRAQALTSLRNEDYEKDFSGGAMVINNETSFVHGGSINGYN